ncbi:MAG: PadR family transcriptional regulator [Caulobacterales bacterium]
MTMESGSDELGKWESQLRKGGLGMAVLASLWSGRLYGLEMLRRLESEAGLCVQEGTIYPLLNRLKIERLVEAEWVQTDVGHPRKYYSLTELGRRRLREMDASWKSFVGGLDRLLAPLNGAAS